MTAESLEDVVRCIILALIFIAVVILSFSKAGTVAESGKTSCPAIESAVR